MEKSIFRKSSLDRISSPEKLNDYIRVSSPGVWIILAAMLILVATLFVWAIWGNIPITYTLMGEARDGKVVCYFSPEDAAMVKPGMEARIGNTSGRVQSVSSVPLSYYEAANLYESEYTVHRLGISEWNVDVTIDAQVADGLHMVTIIADTQRPISFLAD